MKSRIAGFAEFAKAGEPIGTVLVYEDTEGKRLKELMGVLSKCEQSADDSLMPPEGDKEQ